jgi:hypothetical protein
LAHLLRRAYAREESFIPAEHRQHTDIHVIVIIVIVVIIVIIVIIVVVATTAANVTAARPSVYPSRPSVYPQPKKLAVSI